MYSKALVAGWGDMDFNAHMRNTAYLDKAADVRMMFFAEHGFPMAEFSRIRIGPVIAADQIDYFKEVGLLETLSVTLGLAGLSQDGRRFRMRNEFYRQDGKLAARLTSSGLWLDLAARRPVEPPAALRAALEALPRTDDFELTAAAAVA